MTTNRTTSAASSPTWSVPGETGGVQPSTGSATGSDLATKEVFLELLVAQIKNQNPLNPMDGVEFLGQLSQFTQVEQTLGMRQDLSRILSAIQANGATPSPDAAGGNAASTGG
jgi:flagellar basal-body rod modification protein FlgD